MQDTGIITIHGTGAMIRGTVPTGGTSTHGTIILGDMIRGTMTIGIGDTTTATIIRTIADGTEDSVIGPDQDISM